MALWWEDVKVFLQWGGALEICRDSTTSQRVGEESGPQPEGPIDALQHYLGGDVLF